MMKAIPSQGRRITVPSIRQLAPLLGVSHTMLNRQLKRGKFSQEANGGYNVEKVRAALKSAQDLVQPTQAKSAGPQVAEAAKQADDGSDSSFAAYNRAKAFREQIRAKQSELDLKFRMGELVSAAEVQKTWERHIDAVKNRLLLLASKVPAECRALVDAEIRSALYEFAGAADTA